MVEGGAMKDTAMSTEGGGGQVSQEKQVKLTTPDGGEFLLPRPAAVLSQLVTDSIPDGGDDDGDDDDDSGNDDGNLGGGSGGEAKEAVLVELLRVNKACLEKVVEFLTHYNEEPMNPIPTPLGAGTFEEVVTQEWYRNFCNEDSMPREMLFDVLRAANYMSIPPLLDLACLKVTFQLHGRNAEEIREMLNLPVLTPEEEARAREEHRWIFENAN